jgi:hypothetical protein
MPLRRLEDCAIIRDYKGFRSRQSPDSDNYQNAFFVREDGREACVGQTHDIVKTAEWYIRQPLPTWMTGKNWPEFASHYDEAHVKRTCIHDVLLDEVCYSCAESYGEARMR